MYQSLLISFFFIANLLCLTYANALQEIPQDHRHMIERYPYRILGIGAACMDLIIPVSEEILSQVPGAKGGAEEVDLNQLNSIIAKTGSVPNIATGGSCANTIKGLASLGEKCAFLSHIGSDPMGEHFAQYMQRLGVVNLFARSELPTTRVLCLVTPDGQRTMRFCGGCAQEMSDQFLHPDYFKGVKIVHIDAYGLRNGNLVKRALQLAKEAGAKVSLDLASFEMVRKHHATLMEILPMYVDIVFGNEDETRALTGLDPKEGCRKLQEMCPIAVVLMSHNGCLVNYQGNILHSPAFPSKMVDSTGAGDLFACGFLYGYLQGYPIDKCARLGNLLGGAIVEIQGAELPPGKWQEIRALLQGW